MQEVCTQKYPTEDSRKEARAKQFAELDKDKNVLITLDEWVRKKPNLVSVVLYL